MRKSAPLLLLLSFVWLSACASKERPEPKYHPATLANDLFPVEQGMPVREVRQNQQFFPKKCDLMGRQPYFTKTEYECTDGQ